MQSLFLFRSKLKMFLCSFGQFRNISNNIRNSNYHNSIENFEKNNATKIILDAKHKSKLTFQQLSDELQVNKVIILHSIILHSY